MNFSLFGLDILAILANLAILAILAIFATLAIFALFNYFGLSGNFTHCAYFDYFGYFCLTTNFSFLGYSSPFRWVTLWKFRDFSVIQILREINFGESRSCKTAVNANLGALTFVTLANFSLQKVQKFMKIKIRSI